jgi:hypothetical protein
VNERQQEKGKRVGHPPEKPSVVPVEVRFPPEVVTQYHTEQSKSYGLQNRTFLVSVLTLLALVIYTCITYRQWGAMLDSNKISRESLESVQRAFMVFDTIEINVVSYSAPPQELYESNARFLNTGTTPATDFAQAFTAQELDAEPNEEEFLIKPTIHSAYSGPKAIYRIGVERKDSSFFKKSTKLKVFWGWLAYRDVFPATPLHITEFCQEVIEYIPITKTQMHVGFGNCQDHNCVDNQCKDYKQVAALALHPN